MSPASRQTIGGIEFRALLKPRPVARFCSRGWTGPRSAFTLFEMLVAIGILALLIGLSLANLRPATVSAQANSMASVLVQALRSAQQKAVAQQFPVGIAIPYQAANPLSQSIYWLEGEHHPKVTRVQQMGGDLPESCLAAVSYAGPTFVAGLPGGTASSGFYFSAWDAPFPNHKMVVFLPTGEAVANFSHRNGRYTIVVATGMRCSADTLTGASNPVTVSVSSRGEVSVVPGLEGASSSLVLAPGNPSSRPHPASIPSQFSHVRQSQPRI